MIDFRRVDQWHIGNNEVEKAWLNGVLVWMNNKHLPFYVENITNEDQQVAVSWEDSNYYAPSITIYTSWDNITWELWGTTRTAVLSKWLPAGSRLFMRANATHWALMDSASNPGGGMAFNVIHGMSKVGGNIMSLLYGSNFEGKTTITNEQAYHSAFGRLFYGYQNNLVDASNLILPATTLANNCYNRMFDTCTVLEKAPVLPATTLVEGCYSSMFSGCTALENAPELPATTLANYCYRYMFSGCTALENAPELPALTLAQDCYNSMFQGCTSLETAPELPAPTLVQSCYSLMFYNCPLINSIKCLATDISAFGCTSFWVDGVAANGTFIKNPNMSSWSTGTSGIPSGWTIQDAS